MKIWMKTLIGLILGIGLALLIPEKDIGILNFIGNAAKLVIQIGRYVLVPLLFFSIAVSVYELREDKRLLALLGKTLGFIAIFTAVLVAFGVVSVLIVQPARIQHIPSDTTSSLQTIDVMSALLALFPKNLITTITQGSDFLLPMAVLALLLGLSFALDRGSAKVLIPIFNAFSQVFYSINTLFTEFLGIGIIAVTVNSVFSLRKIVEIQMYRDTIILLVADTLIVAFLLIPLIIYLFNGRKNPYRVIYAMIAPAISALVSGDINFAFGTLIKHTKESLGVQRRANSVSLTLAAVLGRAGSTMIAATTFIIILKSHTLIGVSFQDVLWIIAYSWIISLFLGTLPGEAAFVATITFCSAFQPGFETGWMLVKPIAVIIIACGAFLDILIAGAVSLLAAKSEGYCEDRELRYFV